MFSSVTILQSGKEIRGVWSAISLFLGGKDMSHISMESCHTYEWVTSHIWMSDVTHMHESCLTRMYESCHTYECLAAHMWMSHVTHVNESYHTCEWVISHMWMSHGPRVHESWPTVLRAAQRHHLSSHMKSHVTHVNASCHTYEWVMSHT